MFGSSDTRKLWTDITGTDTILVEFSTGKRFVQELPIDCHNCLPQHVRTATRLELESPDEIRQRARTLAEQAEERGATTGVHPAGSQRSASTVPVAKRGDG